MLEAPAGCRDAFDPCCWAADVGRGSIGECAVLLTEWLEGDCGPWGVTATDDSGLPGAALWMGRGAMKDGRLGEKEEARIRSDRVCGWMCRCGAPTGDSGTLCPAPWEDTAPNQGAMGPPCCGCRLELRLLPGTAVPDIEEAAAEVGEGSCCSRELVAVITCAGSGSEQGGQGLRKTCKVQRTLVLADSSKQLHCSTAPHCRWLQSCA